MRTIHLVHGFNVHDKGRASTDRLIPYAKKAGLAVRQHDYGWRGLLGVRFANRDTAQRIVRATRGGDIGVGHSNGGLILVQAARLGAPLEGLVLIHPALESTCEFPAHLKWIHVYHGEPDAAVKAAQLLDWLPWNWFAKHPWGDMGAVGYKGKDPRVTNFDDGLAHSGSFPSIEIWGPRIMTNVARATGDWRLA